MTRIGVVTDTRTPVPTTTRTNTVTQTPFPVGTVVGQLVIAGGVAAGIVSTVYVASVHDTGLVTAWTPGPALPAVRSHGALAAVALAGGSVYVAGGDAQAFPVPDSAVGTVAGGAVTAWATSSPIAGTGASAPSKTTDGAGTIYLAGGFSDFFFTAPVADVYAGTVAAGEFTAWASGPPLPVARGEGALAFAGGYLFHAGGGDLAAGSSAIYRAPAAGTTVGAWSSVSPTLPAERVGAISFVAANRIFILGGRAGGLAAGATSTIWSAPVTAGTLGGWATSPPMPSPRAEAAWCFVPAGFAGDLVFVGGYQGANQVVSTVYTAAFASGTLSSWSTSLAFPWPVNGHAAY